MEDYFRENPNPAFNTDVIGGLSDIQTGLDNLHRDIRLNATSRIAPIQMGIDTIHNNVRQRAIGLINPVQSGISNIQQKVLSTLTTNIAPIADNVNTLTNQLNSSAVSTSGSNAISGGDGSIDNPFYGPPYCENGEIAPLYTSLRSPYGKPVETGMGGPNNQLTYFTYASGVVIWFNCAISQVSSSGPCADVNPPCLEPWATDPMIRTITVYNGDCQNPEYDKAPKCEWLMCDEGDRYWTMNYTTGSTGDGKAYCQLVTGKTDSDSYNNSPIMVLYKDLLNGTIPITEVTQNSKTIKFPDGNALMDNALAIITLCCCGVVANPPNGGGPSLPPSGGSCPPPVINVSCPPPVINVTNNVECKETKTNPLQGCDKPNDSEFQLTDCWGAAVDQLFLDRGVNLDTVQQSMQLAIPFKDFLVLSQGQWSMNNE